MYTVVVDLTFFFTYMIYIVDRFMDPSVCVCVYTHIMHSNNDIHMCSGPVLDPRPEMCQGICRQAATPRCQGRVRLV